MPIIIKKKRTDSFDCIIFSTGHIYFRYWFLNFAVKIQSIASQITFSITIRRMKVLPLGE